MFVVTLKIVHMCAYRTWNFTQILSLFPIRINMTFFGGIVNNRSIFKSLHPDEPLVNINCLCCLLAIECSIFIFSIAAALVATSRFAASREIGLREFTERISGVDLRFKKTLSKCIKPTGTFRLIRYYVSLFHKQFIFLSNHRNIPFI